MIGSLLNDLQPEREESAEEPENSEVQECRDGDEDSLVETMEVVRKIVSRKTSMFWYGEVSDIVQAVSLRLIKWRDKYREKSNEMTPEEWESFAARTAYNEMNREYRKSSQVTLVNLEFVCETADDKSIEGQTRTEVISVAMNLWQQICKMPQKQRQSLLLGSRLTISYFMMSGVKDVELADKLDLSLETWNHIRHKLPLTYDEIAKLIEGEKACEARISKTRNYLRKARHAARKKLRKGEAKR